MNLLTFSLGIPLSFIALASGVLLATTSKWGLFGCWWGTTRPALLVVVAAAAQAALVLIASVLTVFRPGGRIRTHRTTWRGSQ